MRDDPTAVARDGLDLVAVDPPSLIHAHPPTDSQKSHVAEVLRRLKQLAMQLRIHIIATAELERPPQPSSPYLEPRDPPPPQLSDLSDEDAVLHFSQGAIASRGGRVMPRK